jgi:hypothetical protein
MNKEIKGYQEIIEAAKKVDVASSPFLATRVMASLSTVQRKDRSLFVWKSFSGLMAAFAIAFAVLLFSPESSVKQALVAKINRPVVVRIETQELKAMNSDIVVAEVELPEGVFFESKKYPKLALERSLRLNMALDTKQPYLPVMIRGEHAGVKTIQVKFLDKDRKVVSVKKVPIEFKDNPQSL